jgi:hypothetical protein
MRSLTQSSIDDGIRRMGRRDEDLFVRRLNFEDDGIVTREGDLSIVAFMDHGGEKARASIEHV